MSPSYCENKSESLWLLLSCVMQLVPVQIHLRRTCPRSAATCWTSIWRMKGSWSTSELQASLSLRWGRWCTSFLPGAPATSELWIACWKNILPAPPPQTSYLDSSPPPRDQNSLSKRQRLPAKRGNTKVLKRSNSDLNRLLLQFQHLNQDQLNQTWPLNSLQSRPQQHPRYQSTQHPPLNLTNPRNTRSERSVSTAQNC